MFRLIPVVMAVLTLVSAARAQEPKKKADSSKERPSNIDSIVKPLLERVDRNKDGKISKEEAASMPRIIEAFDRVDQNKDGVIDNSELPALVRLLRPGGPPGKRPGPGGFGPGGLRSDPLDFDAQDKDADGRLTRAELRGTRFEDQFDNIDANKDRKIDPKEWAAFHKKK